MHFGIKLPTWSLPQPPPGANPLFHQIRLRSSWPYSPPTFTGAGYHQTIPTGKGHFRSVLASESHWLQPLLVLIVRWWSGTSKCGRANNHPSSTSKSTPTYISLKPPPMSSPQSTVECFTPRSHQTFRSVLAVKLMEIMCVYW